MLFPVHQEHPLRVRQPSLERPRCFDRQPVAVVDVQDPSGS